MTDKTHFDTDEMGSGVGGAISGTVDFIGDTIGGTMDYLTNSAGGNKVGVLLGTGALAVGASLLSSKFIFKGEGMLSNIGNLAVALVAGFFAFDAFNTKGPADPSIRLSSEVPELSIIEGMSFDAATGQLMQPDPNDATKTIPVTSTFLKDMEVGDNEMLQTWRSMVLLDSSRSPTGAVQLGLKSDSDQNFIAYDATDIGAALLRQNGAFELTDLQDALNGQEFLPDEAADAIAEFDTSVNGTDYTGYGYFTADGHTYLVDMQSATGGAAVNQATLDTLGSP